MNDTPPRRRLLSDNLAVALGTGLSRLTGFARIIVLGWVLIPAIRLPGGDADALFKLFSDNLIPQARYVSAGVVGTTHAQEHGFALLFVG